MCKEGTPGAMSVNGVWWDPRCPSHPLSPVHDQPPAGFPGKRPANEVRFLLLGPMEKHGGRIVLTGDLEHDRLIMASTLREFLRYVHEGHADGALKIREDTPDDPE